MSLKFECIRCHAVFDSFTALVKHYKRVHDPDLSSGYGKYRDEGCALAPSCLNCPFPQCIYDEPGGALSVLKRFRDEEIRKKWKAGIGSDIIAKEFNISARTVNRILKVRLDDK